MQKRQISFLIILISWISHLSAVPFESCLACSGGLRNDEVKNHICGYVFLDVPVFSDRAKSKHMNIWEVGLQARLASPYDECSWWWLQQYYMRGYAFWGWGNSGSYHESFRLDLPPKHPDLITANVHKVRTQNYNIALGWLYPLDCKFGMGPVGGYSYDSLNYSIYDVYCSGRFTERLLNDSRIKSSYQGPWVGVDAAYVWCDLTFYTGYEYHWITRWRGSNTLHGKEHIFKYSDVRSSHRGQGNVFYADFRWTLCDWCESGLGFRYSHLVARHGKARPTEGNFITKGLPCRFSKVKTAKWISYAVTLDAGITY